MTDDELTQAIATMTDNGASVIFIRTNGTYTAYWVQRPGKLFEDNIAQLKRSSEGSGPSAVAAAKACQDSEKKLNAPKAPKVTIGDDEVTITTKTETTITKAKDAE